MKIVLQGKLVNVREPDLAQVVGDGRESSHTIVVRVGYVEYTMTVNEKQAQEAGKRYGKPVTITFDLGPTQEGGS